MKKLLPLTLSIFLIFGGLSLSNGYIQKGLDLDISISFPPLNEIFIINENGKEKIVMEDCGYLLIPGKPMLPSKSFIIDLPAHAKYDGINFEVSKTIMLNGRYDLVAMPKIIVPSSSKETKKLKDEWNKNNLDAYSSDNPFPGEIGNIKGFGTKQSNPYVVVEVYPFQYCPKSGKLFYYKDVQVKIKYKLEPNSNKFERGAHINENYDYVIITSESLYPAIKSVDFIEWKELLGYKVKIVNVTDKEILSQSGKDLAQKIRNFLRNYYEIWGIKYVLIVGDHTIVPMRYCYPSYGEVPTDSYYADLSYPDEQSWDSDGDGRYGEYGEDKPDFKAEVYIGRIPTNDADAIKYTLNKIVNFEKDMGEWKNAALHAGAILFFENQDNSGYPFVDGARGLDAIEKDCMQGWKISHYSEQEGLIPSTYQWNALNEETFTNDWRSNKYAIVNWEGHGAPSGVSRLIWAWDDGDGVPESGSEIRQPSFFHTYSNVDDDYPSIVFAVSCNVGRPEPVEGGNLGIKMLTDSSLGCSVAVLSATRGAAVAADFSSHSGAEAICYDFNRYLINENRSVGEALYEAKFYIHKNFGWDHYLEYQNIFDYNLYGDPSMKRICKLPQIKIIEPENYIYLVGIKIIPFLKPIAIGKVNVRVIATSDVSHVEFCIDDKLKYVDNEQPYEWTWKEFAFGKHEIKVVAYNENGGEAEDNIEVWKIL